MDLGTRRLAPPRPIVASAAPDATRPPPRTKGTAHHATVAGTALQAARQPSHW
jgi:hypothetical protein